MWLRVATGVLHCTVAEAQARLTSYEFGELCAFYRIEPWDGSRQEWASAVQAARMIASRTGRAVNPYGLAPYIPPPEDLEDQDEDDMRGQVDRFADA